MNIDEDILKIKNKKLKIKKLNDLNKLCEILEYTKFLDEFNPDINERLYCFINSINKVKTCLICNKKLKFYGFSKGYRNYCSKKCAASDKNRLEKIEKTCLNKYGVSHFTKTKQYQENWKKSFIKKYNVDNPSKLDFIKEKKRLTCLKNFDVEYPMQSNEIKRKYKETCLEKYDVDNVFKSEMVKRKYKRTCLKRYGVDNYAKTPEHKARIRENWKTNKNFIVLNFKNKFKEKYGIDNPSKLQVIKEKIKETNMKRYNSIIFLSSEKYKKLKREKYYNHLKLLLSLKNIELLSTKDEYINNDIFNFKCLICGETFKSSRN